MDEQPRLDKNIWKKKEIPVGNTRPGELFTFFTGIILTAETEREHKGTSFAANIKVQKMVHPEAKNISAGTNMPQTFLTTLRIWQLTIAGNFIGNSSSEGSDFINKE